jgi:Domain of unknown function (DUF4333)
MHISTSSSHPTSTRGAGARRGPTAVIVALAAAALISACGSASPSATTAEKPIPKAILNTKRIAGSIEQSILSERHIHAKVSCPAVVPQEKGRTFACIATVGKTKTPFTVEQQNDRGYVTYKGE